MAGFEKDGVEKNFSTAEKIVMQSPEEAINKILTSKSRKKLIVAGPGAGKTTLFQKLLQLSDKNPKQHLVLTFITSLKKDLARNLGELAQVYTLHGYCQHLLRKHEYLRNGLSKKFRCHPGLELLIKKDWMWLNESKLPDFKKLMRSLTSSDDQVAFYIDRSNYYDAIDFDDSVYRIYKQLLGQPETVPNYALVLIDEFQDFNLMEAAVIELLSKSSCIVIAGDDDQALYSKLRAANWDYIRAYYSGGDYEVFELPFCMRCPEVIVDAVNDIVGEACAAKKLNGRINKPFLYYEPVTGEDSRRYPTIRFVETSVQRSNANYFGRYIKECIQAIPEEEMKQAADKNEPAVLIIVSKPYRSQVEEHLTSAGLLIIKEKVKLSEYDKALKILKADSESNLGWRIILSCGDQEDARQRVREAAEKAVSLRSVMDDAYCLKILNEAQSYGGDEAVGIETAEEKTERIVVTSYEGSKGRSAQYVFLVGLHSRELPKDSQNIEDIEICRFLVGLTRTKKRCTILTTRRFGKQTKRPSEFLGWIKNNRYELITVDAAYWKAH